MSRRRTPNHLKLITGTDQPCRMDPDEDVGAHALEELPDAPDWLPNAHATKEWNRLGKIALRLGRLTEANQMTFAHLCALHGKLVQLWSAGQEPTGFLLSQYRTLTNDFGLTSATSASARKIGSDPEKKGRFDRFKKPD